MKKVLSIIIAVSVFIMPGAASSQPAPPPPTTPSVAGEWALSLKVTKGNKTDETRIGHGGTMACALSGQDVICQIVAVSDYGASLLSVLEGKIDGTTLALNGKWPCGYENCGIDIHFTGSAVNHRMLGGQWTALMYVGLGRYEAGGTWKAIKLKP